MSLFECVQSPVHGEVPDGENRLRELWLLSSLVRLFLGLVLTRCCVRKAVTPKPKATLALHGVPPLCTKIQNKNIVARCSGFTVGRFLRCPIILLRAILGGVWE